MMNLMTAISNAVKTIVAKLMMGSTERASR